MKTPTFCLLLAFGLLSAQAHAGTVTLTSADVTSALDIEAAIQSATAGGTEPGTVILDGSAGAFEYTNGDMSINIGNVSNLTLRGINSARIVNCDDGVFFDANPVSNILIEGLVLQCVGDGIDARFGLGPREGVTVRRNVILSDGSEPGQGTTGIVVADGRNWRIARNIIIGGSGAAQSAVELIGGADATVINNLLVGFLGVAVVFDPVGPPTGHRIVENRIEALQTGVRLDDAATENRVLDNRICLYRSAGPAIFLGPDTSNNLVRRNEAALVSGGNLVVVEDLGTANNKSGNTRRRRC
jgi:hypothetical protein